VLDHLLIEDDRLLILTPFGPLEASDIKSVASEVDPIIEERGRLDGLIVEAEPFPGWSNFSGLIEHIGFVRDHHRRIGKVAMVSDDRILSILRNIASHFVATEVRHFPYASEEEALRWLRDDQAT
tara:strand:- start:39701 stop:40075 length:375 start_codon:yes stop_codon:yes gene_type:complete